MKISDFSFRPLVGVLGLSLLPAACIIDDGSDDGNVSGVTSSDSQSSNTNATTSDTVDGTGSDGGNTGTPACEGPNAVADPSFEGGSPSAEWTESSEVFVTPICDSTCTEEEGAVPYAGDWWVWFGGIVDDAESASVSQEVTIPAADMAQLSFYFQIRSGAGTGDDVFLVEMIDGDITDTLWMATDNDMPLYAGGYHRIDVDVTPWADDGTYTLRFSGSVQGTALTSFFLDEISVTSCDDESGTDTGTSTGVDDTGSGSDSGTSSGSDSGSGSGSDSGGSSSGTGGSSGSTGM